ncbi:MAG: response regulator [Candidatus Sumerlaeota bacterium]|nr:response regulator [Candidatus Sumerlaeota bacterium]
MKSTPRYSGQTILVVDGEKPVFDVLSRIFADNGYATIWAENGRRAVAVAASTNLDLIILDLYLPDGCGLEVMEELKTVCSDVPMIILTGHGSRDTVRSAMEAGVFDYLTKPFKPKDLRTVVQNALEAERVFMDCAEDNYARS